MAQNRHSKSRFKNMQSIDFCQRSQIQSEKGNSFKEIVLEKIGNHMKK